jgi:hypothetical protein
MARVWLYERGMRRLWICAAAVVLMACGHSDEELEAKQREVERAHAALLVATKELHDEKAQLESQQRAVDEIKRTVELEILEARVNGCSRDEDKRTPKCDCK